MLHKILSFLVLIFLSLGFLPQELFANDDNYFVVTAYYSPLPGQKHYLKWNYEDEKRLNGQWIAGASWKKVFSWMLAAPKKYGFGTKIQLEWLWVGVVEDRWWAIVPAWKRWYSHDRIDVWVGYGDEWLRRALYWGKRKVKGKVISRWSNTTLDYSTIPAPLWATNGLRKIPNVFHIPLGKGSNTSSVIELQKLLQEVWKYDGKVDGIYNSEVIDIIYDFQIENNIVKNEQSFWAWYWGATTRNLFLKKYISGELTQEQSQKKQGEKKILEVFDTPLKHTQDTEILQDILIEMGLYKDDIDGNYKSIEKSIYNYQISKDIVKNETEIWAWVFGPKTRASLRESYTEYLDFKKRQLELEKIYSDIEEESIEEAKNITKEIGTPKYGNIDTNVRELQVWMNKIWYFDYKDTAIFWVKTKNSIIEFQIEKWVIDTPHETWAGIFGPKTKEAFENEVKNIILQQKLEESEIFEELQAFEDNKQLPENAIGTIEKLYISTI